VEMAREAYPLALEHVERALSIRRHLLGNENLKLVENLIQLATLYLITGQKEKSEPLLLQTLAIYQQAQKPDDLMLDPALSILALLAQEHGHIWQATMYVERLRKIRSQVWGDTSQEMAEIWTRLALLASAEEAWDEAETCVLHALHIQQDMFGPEDPHTLESLEQLAAIFVRQGKPQTARETLQQILQIKIQTRGEGDSDLTGDLLALVHVTLLLQDYSAAETYVNRLATLYQQDLHLPLLSLIALLGELATVLESLSYQDQADWIAQQVQALLLQSFGK